MIEGSLDTGSAADQIADLLPDGPDEEELSQETGEEPDEQPILENEEAESGELEEAADDALDEVDEEAEDEEAGIETLQELADALEVPLEELLGNMKTTLKASGEDHTVTLADLQKSYQQEADYTKKSMALADERRGFEAERQRKIEEFQANHNALARMTEFVGNGIKAEFNSPKLAELRETNPQEWQARRYELEQQFNQLGKLRQEASANYSQVLQQQQEQFVIEQGKILSETVDGWGEEKLQESIEVIKDLGFHDEELSNVVDARLFKGALRLKAAEDRVRELEAQIAKGSEAAQKVKQKPSKVLKAGKTPKVSRSKLANAKANLRKSAQGRKDNTREAAAVIENLL